MAQVVFYPICAKTALTLSENTFFSVFYIIELVQVVLTPLVFGGVLVPDTEPEQKTKLAQNTEY